MADKTIQSIDKAVEILNYIADNGTMARLTQISDDLNINKSTLYGILKTLEANNMIYKDCDANYKLGPAIMKLGLKMKFYDDIISKCETHLNYLKSKFDETLFISTFSKQQVKYIKVVSNRSNRNKSGINSCLHATASGKLYLAHMQSKEVENYLKSQRLRTFTSNTITTTDQIYEELDEIRANRISVQLQEFESGYFSCAAPIYQNKQLVAAIGVLGFTSQIDFEILEELKNELKKASILISKNNA